MYVNMYMLHVNKCLSQLTKMSLAVHFRVEVFHLDAQWPTVHVTLQCRWHVTDGMSLTRCSGVVALHGFSGLCSMLLSFPLLLHPSTDPINVMDALNLG